MSSDDPSTYFVTERAEYEARRKAGESVVLARALHAPQRVADLADYYRAIADSVDRINVLNPFSSAKALARFRGDFKSRQIEASAMLKDVIERIGEPTEGASASDLGWMQGFTLAAGMSAFSNLQTAVSAASEALDRKSAYSLAGFSLYVAAVSLVATVVLGLLSLR